MHYYIPKLKDFRFHPLIEFIIVVSFSLGYFVYLSLQYTHYGNAGLTTVSYGDTEIFKLVGYELSILLIIFLFLKWQNKDFKIYGFSFSIDKITHGLILFITNYLLYLLLFKIFGDLLLSSPGNNAGTPAAVNYTINIGVGPLIIFSVLNPVFEEFILVGYIVSAAGKRFGLIISTAISVFFRLSFHIYQGPVILLSILPMGIIFTVYFWYKKSIIPLVIGHGVMDFLSFYIFMILYKG